MLKAIKNLCNIMMKQFLVKRNKLSMGALALAPVKTHCEVSG